jgi:hypothetical protein
MARHAGWRTTVEPRFHGAALVVSPTLGAVLVAEVHLDARDPIAEAAQRALYDRGDVGGEAFAAFDAGVRSELNLHLGFDVLGVGWLRPSRIRPFFEWLEGDAPTRRARAIAPLLAALEARGIELAPKHREMLDELQTVEELIEYVRRAAVANCADEVFR